VLSFLDAITVGIAIAMLLSLYRLLSGPTLWDRLSGLGLLGTKTIVLLLVIGVRTGREDIFVDITLAYTLISFIGSLALAKYFEGKLERKEPDRP
jgi:multicomponent Na+:H+ antiporter subunit F